MARLKLPANLRERNGRYYWDPGPRVREKGFKGRALTDEAGRPLALADAIKAAEAINLEVRTGQAPRRRTPTKTSRTVRALWERYEASPRFTRLAKSSQADYRWKMRVFLDAFGDEPLAAIEPHHLYPWWEEIVASRGHAMANGIIAVARACLSHARRIGWRADNPARKLELVSVPPRVVVWTPAECDAFVRTADAMGLHGAGDAFFIGLHTAQRQGDVLALPVPQLDGTRTILRQAKTGARVAVPYTPELKARLDLILARRKRQAVVRIDAPLVLDANGNRYTKTTHGRDFRRVREAVAIELPDAGKKEYRDLRDTAISRLAWAGCTSMEIAAISGHELKTIHTVMKHYYAMHAGTAGIAMEKLGKWMKEEGIAV